MPLLRAHSDVIAAALTLRPGDVGRVLRAHHAHLGVVVHEQRRAEFPGFGSFAFDYAAAVAFTATPEANDAVLHGSPLPGDFVPADYAAAVARQTRLDVGVISLVISEHMRLICSLTHEGQTLTYSGFGKYQRGSDGLMFTPGSVLVAAVDAGYAPPVESVGSRAQSPDQMALNEDSQER